MSYAPEHDDFATLRVERDDDERVLRVFLHRPERRNAVNDRMMLEVGDLFIRLQQDFRTRVVVLGGDGASFCSGADRKPDDQPLAEPVGERERRFRAHLGRRAARAIEECEITTVARVQGHAAGGGAVWAVSCDFRVATEEALLWYPEIELGMPLTWAATPRLIGEIGMARARQLVLLCERITGRTAFDWGLVHETVPADGLDAAVDRWVARLLELPDLAVHMTKTQFRAYGRNVALGDVSEADADQIVLARATPETQARIRAPFDRRQ